MRRPPGILLEGEWRCEPEELPVMRVMVLGVALCLVTAFGAAAQVPVDPNVAASVEVSPARLTLGVGETARLVPTVRNAAGEILDPERVVYFSRARRSVTVSADGEVEAFRPGEFTLVVLVPENPADERARPDARAEAEVLVSVPQPPVAQVTFTGLPPKFYVGTRPQLTVQVTDAVGKTRDDVRVAFSTRASRDVSVGPFGFLSLDGVGTFEVTATAEGVSETASIEVEPNPVSALELQSSVETARTGDVVRFTASAKDARGLPVRSVPVQFGVGGATTPTIIAAGAAAQMTDDGRFVAERSGIYTVVASTGSHSAARTVSIVPRDVAREVEVVGRGKVLDRHTSDLWIWEGTDGRDYAITGTWGADGHSYVWDVTDPAQIEKLHEVQVDARTINDVKVSEDGDIAVIGREGASDRKNGIVVLGVGNPREGVPVLGEFTDQLTGGVHNLFIAEDHVFALSAGRRYDVISIKDPSRPQRVGRFELGTPGHSVHDVWVSEGVAFSSNWTDGVVAVDVGGGGRGGTPERPVELGRYTYPSGWNHAAFPYRSQSTGTFYVFAGDESFPYGGLSTRAGGTPSRAAGWIHIIDWSDWDNPREVARYQVPEAGSHNLWIEDDVMYVAFYNGGLRVVDVSGELLGDLYQQGREIAMFLPGDPQGYIANAPFVWGPQPYKGHVFFTDWNTGLWAVKLNVPANPDRVIGEPR